MAVVFGLRPVVHMSGVENEVLGAKGKKGIHVTPAPGVKRLAHDLHVLLRHRLLRKAEVGEGVQAGTRVPMVLNVAARAVSGPLDIRGDHSDFYYALNTGWIVLCARDPQAVYDLNFAAIRIGEHPDVRLPVMVVYDGFFTSHQKRRIQVFDDEAAMRGFLGERPQWPTPLDVEHPATFGAYMNDPDLINNKVQLSQAMEAARRVIPQIFAELEQVTGRP